eukprot:SAG25_NODE_11135_length_313_cov_0.308411_1_plen_37_part_01
MGIGSGIVKLDGPGCQGRGGGGGGRGGAWGVVSQLGS